MVIPPLEGLKSVVTSAIYGSWRDLAQRHFYIRVLLIIRFRKTDITVHEALSLKKVSLPRVTRIKKKMQ